MKIVKLKTNLGRILYAIQVRPEKKSFWRSSPAIYLSVTGTKNAWHRTEDIFEFCVSDSLPYVEMALKKACIPKEKIIKVIARKCKCKCECGK